MNKNNINLAESLEANSTTIEKKKSENILKIQVDEYKHSKNAM